MPQTKRPLEGDPLSASEGCTNFQGLIARVALETCANETKNVEVIQKHTNCNGKKGVRPSLWCVRAWAEIRASF